MCFTTFLEATLHDAAPMLMRANLDAVLHTSIEDELGISLKAFTPLNVWLFGVLRSLEDAKESLNHMVSMSVLDSEWIRFRFIHTRLSSLM